jgi:hypothetical protein
MPSETKDDSDKPEGKTAKPAAKSGSGKPLIGRTAAVGIGIGSAALVAALLYASRWKPGSK